MDELNELYQEVIIDHSKRPRNLRRMDHADKKADGYNPLCGDKVTIYLKLVGDVITDLSFEGSGCAISTASVSMLTEFLKGKKVEEVGKYFKKFQQLVTTDNAPAEDLNKLAIFHGVRQFPTRVKCATLAWHTLKSALEGKKAPVKTE